MATYQYVDLRIDYMDQSYIFENVPVDIRPDSRMERSEWRNKIWEDFIKNAEFEILKPCEREEI